MRKMGKMVALMVALMMVFSCAALAEEDTIKIGGIAPLTGTVANYGLLVQNGVNTYIDEINENGGIDGKKVEIEWMDDTGDAVEATNAYNTLVSDGVAAVIGPVTTTPTLAVASLAAKDNMPMITASATAYAVTDAGSNVFRACFLDPYQAGIMAEYAVNSLGAKTAAILYDNTDSYFIGLYEGFTKKAEELGLEIVATETAASGDADYTAQLTKIADAEPDVVFVCYYYEDAALILRQAKNDVGIEATLIGADSWSGIGAQLEDEPTLLDGTAYCDSFYADDDDETVKSFVARFTDSHNGTAPQGFNALGYDAAKIMITAIANAGSTDKDAIIAALKATDLDCATGHITFDDHNDPIKSVCVMGFENGQLKLLEKIAPSK